MAATLTVHVRDEQPRSRDVDFRHRSHGSVACVTCHASPVTLAADSATRTCAGCHDDHHTATADCASCHTGADWGPSHRRPADAHRNCDACHREATVTRLVPTRPLCATCHAFAEPHYPAKECTVCHFLVAPAAYQPHLRRATSPP
jgi:hypothetical protein